MRLRARLSLAMSLATSVTLFVSFAAVSVVVEHSEERQLDEALRAEAREEAIEIASHAPLTLGISERPSLEADGIGRLTKYAALYGPNGTLLDQSESMDVVPPLDVDLRGAGVPFDVKLQRDHVRAVFVHVPGHRDHVLFFGATRADLERDVLLLREVMLVAAIASVLLSVLVTFRIARGLARDHEAIAATARRVSAGDLDARVRLQTSDEEMAQLGQDIDLMIERLEILVGSQQRFIAHAAHELRSPLATLKAELQVAIRRERPAEEYRAAIQDGLESAQRLKALADDLLELARLGAEKFNPTEKVDVKSMIENASAWSKAAADARDVKVVLRADGDLAVNGRTIDLERMVRNLVDNAVRHAPIGSEVRIDVGTSEHHVEIAVIDAGAGVSAPDRERIFDPFYRSAEVRKDGTGSGLGLPIARAIAREHGGDLVLVVKESGGHFTVTLPLD